MKINFFLLWFFSVQVCLRHFIPRCLKCGFLLFHLRSPVGILLQADDVCAPAMKAALMYFCCLSELANRCTLLLLLLRTFHKDCIFLWRLQHLKSLCDHSREWEGGWRGGNKVASLIPAGSWLAVSHYSAQLQKSQLNVTRWRSEMI